MNALCLTQVFDEAIRTVLDPTDGKNKKKRGFGKAHNVNKCALL